MPKADKAVTTTSPAEHPIGPPTGLSDKPHTRRAALRGTGSMVLATALVPLPVLAGGTTGDGELLALGRELAASWARERQILAAIPRPSTIESEEPYEAACDVTAAIVDRIEAVPATTLDGLKVKAQAISWQGNRV